MATNIEKTQIPDDLVLVTVISREVYFKCSCQLQLLWICILSNFANDNLVILRYIHTFSVK